LSNIRIIIILAVLILFVVFMVQNTQVITVTLLFEDIRMSRVVLILISALAGFIFGYFLARPIRWRRKPKNKPPENVEEASSAE
jgi:uncharacterized integral membrane protein